MPDRRLPKGTFTLPWAKDAPSYQTSRTSDEDPGGQDLFQIAERGAEARQTGGAPKLMDCGGDMEDH